MLIEVCAYSLESCLNAEEGGAGRIELCGGLGEGGTTPSAGLIATVKKHIGIPVYVMIRPRGGDFVYSDAEEEVMMEDIAMAKSLGADGVVFGILDEDGQVDRVRMARLIEMAKPMGVTFHRAFDVTQEPLKALEDIISLGVERILTSGQKATADLGATLLQEIVRKADGRIEIMAGAGVSAGNAVKLKETGVDSLHLTGKSFRPGRQRFFPEGVSMAGEQPDEKTILYSDTEKIRAVVASAN